MDEGWGIVLGAAIGLAGGALGSAAQHVLARRQQDREEAPARALLIKLLSHPVYDWRSIETLSNVVGLDVAATRRLLLQLGARGSERDGDLWGLVSKHPLAEVGSNHDPAVWEATEALEAKWAAEEVEKR